MHLAIHIADVVIIVLALVLAGMLGRSFFYAAIIVLAIMSVARLHYGLNYSWAFVGKYAVNVVVPLVMAWAGNHLAAKSSETKTEKRLWQALFVSLTVLALVGSFWVLTNEEEEHQKEITKLRSGIKGDMAAELIEYNNAHPLHQVTSEQFAGLMNIVSGLSAKSSTPVVATPSKANPFANFTNEELRDAARSTVKQLRDYDPNEWYYLNNKAYRDATNSIRTPMAHFGRPATPEERQNAENEGREKQAAVNGVWRAKTQPLLTTAALLRTVMLTRRVLPERKQNEDREAVTVFARIANGDYDSSELGAATEYLDSLAKRLD